MASHDQPHEAQRDAERGVSDVSESLRCGEADPMGLGDSEGVEASMRWAYVWPGIVSLE